jgi:hypothetical protein
MIETYLTLIKKIMENIEKSVANQLQLGVIMITPSEAERKGYSPYWGLIPLRGISVDLTSHLVQGQSELRNGSAVVTWDNQWDPCADC